MTIEEFKDIHKKYTELLEQRDMLQIQLAAAQQREEVLRLALVILENAADYFAADQSGATDPRCGLVQPVSVAKANKLNEAIRLARDAIRQCGEETGE